MTWVTVVALVTLWGGAAVALADGVRVGSEAEVISEDGANLRGDPSADAAVVELVRGGRYVFVHDQSDGWFRVEFDGTRGWVLGSLLGPARPRFSARGDAATRQADQRAPSRAPVVRLGSETQIASQGGLNLRQEPGTEAPVVELVKNARIVYVIDGPREMSDGFWYKVEFDGTVGWVLGSYLGQVTRGSQAARAAAASPAPPREPAAPAAPSPGNVGEAIAQRAMQFLGHPYAWGGASPRTGFDCSGLIHFVTAQFGVYPGRTSDAQAGSGVSVTGQGLLPGDIVVFANTYARGYTHTGIYIGGGQFVHAEDYGTGVVVSSLNGGYWGAHYAGARRPW